MQDGIVRVALCSHEIKLADPAENAKRIAVKAREAAEGGAKLFITSELSLTGYTCADLFAQDLLLDGAKDALISLAEETKELDMLFTVGLPLRVQGKIYNAAAVFKGGKILGIVPKSFIPNTREFYEVRWFAPADSEMRSIDIGPFRDVPFGTDLIFGCRSVPSLRYAVEICQDLWVPIPPSSRHALAGATVIGNLSASDEVVGKEEYRRTLVASQSARTVSAYIYCSAGRGESTTDLVFTAHNIIAEYGSVLSESQGETGRVLFAEIDVSKLDFERSNDNTFITNSSGYKHIPFDLRLSETTLSRPVSRYPFVPQDDAGKEAVCEKVINLQAEGLLSRLKAIGCRKVVVGLSGGLDSTLAALVCIRAFDRLGLSREGIICITMPGFGTTKRTRGNAEKLAEEFGCTLRTVNISKAVRQHFEDIGHSEDVKNVVYENSQARERTQILMDVANSLGAIVIGTGDLSELALGWATYNGDHMSMYAVNASIPKTLVRYIVSYEAAKYDSEVLRDILATPVSPELLPPKDGEIAQITEDIVGPYELHDFFLYYFVRRGFSPRKIFRYAKFAFDGLYTEETIKKWLETFLRRFFGQQFKRSCLPDGPKVGTVTLSPRGDWRMPSDAPSSLWLKNLQ